jgi:3-deoxy-D-manno-octulosonate 8-phosphate phosphatase (KDO 8-P phosphatase)
MISIKAVALDVDGVLTDGTFIWGPEGEEFKRFSFRDVMGISLAKKAGLAFALISGEDAPLVDRFARKLGITDVYKECKDKASALRDFAGKRDFAMQEVCFIGDDVNDLSGLSIAGFAAAPADAHPEVRNNVTYVAHECGGHGAVREILDYLMANGLSSKQICLGKLNGNQSI